MGDFIQLHALTAYPPSNLNRDDLGRPKTAILGGAPRLRVSSQSLKRTWRTSEVVREHLGPHVGKRTKEIGTKYVIDPLIAAGVDEETALTIATKIGGVFGANQKAKKDSPHNEALIEQLAHIAPEELAAVEALVKQLAVDPREPTKDELDLLRERPAAIDIAMFGRMLAASPRHNVEAACQVAHAITVHRAHVENDYFTAVDDLRGHDEDRGAAHVGEVEFGSGVFYLYVCIDRALLLENLRGDEDLARRAIEALITAIATVAPRGKQASFASRSRASYLMVERGDAQPRSLVMAYVNPVRDADVIGAAIKTLRDQRDRLARAYEDTTRHVEINAHSADDKHPSLTLSELCRFAASSLEEVRA